MKKWAFLNSDIWNRFVLQLLFILFFVEFVKGALLVSMLPVYMDTVLRLSAFSIGLSLSLQYIGDNVFRSPVGWVIDKIGYRSSMLFGVLITFIAVLLIAYTSHLFFIVTACALLGIGTSPLWPCVITGTTEVAGDKAKGTMMSVIYMAWLAGVGLGPVVINFFIATSYESAFRLLIGMMSAVIVVAFFLPGKMIQSSGKPIHTKKEPSLHTKKESRLHRIKRYFIEAKRSLNVSYLFFAAMFAQTFALGLLTPVLTLYARKILHLSPDQYSFLLISGGVITVLFLIPVGKLVDKLGTKWFLHVGFLISSVTMLFFTFNKSITFLYVLVALFGIGYALIIPAWNALIASRIPPEKRGAIWGFFLTIEGSGMIIGPIASGKLWDLIGYHAPFLASGFVLLLLFVLHLFISYEKKVVVR